MSRLRDGIISTSLLRLRRDVEVEWRIVNHWANLRVPSRSVCRGVHLNKNDSRASGYVGTEQGATGIIGRVAWGTLK